MIYVDTMQRHPGNGKRFGGKAKYWCHLMTDGEIDELHEFAKRIGLKREWFQGPPNHHHPHYDLTESMQKRAVASGAKLVTLLEMGRMLAKKDGLL